MMGDASARQPLPDFKGSRFLALGSKGIIACIATIPAEFLGGLNGQVKSIIIRAIYQDHLGAENNQLGDFCRRRGFRGEDYGFLSDCSRHASQGGASISGGGSYHHFGVNLSGAPYHNRAGAVFKGGCWIATLVFYPELIHTELGS